VDSYQDRFSYGLAGAVIAHSGGVTLSQPLTDNVILVDTNGISDIRLINKHTVLTDRFGYAVIPFSNPYRLNEVTINVEDFDPDTEAMISSVRLTPNRGSIVKATYDVQRGRKILATIKQDEKLLPFGAVVRAYNAKDIEVAHGIVDANGQVFISGLSGQETLKVIFKNNFLCSTALNLTKIQPRRNKQSDVLIEKLDLNCRQSGNEKSL
jgi:outer membrane usher protein